MKKNTHPQYNEVVFVDINNNETFNTRSCIVLKDKQNYINLDITSKSHKFFSSKNSTIVKGRLEKFLIKYKKN